MVAKKFDAEKPDLTLVTRAFKEATARAMMHGLKKYGRDNFREGGFTELRLLASCLRHLDAYVDGETIDGDSGNSHLDHACGALNMLLDLKEKGLITDDRYTGCSEDCHKGAILFSGTCGGCAGGAIPASVSATGDTISSDNQDTESSTTINNSWVEAYRFTETEKEDTEKESDNNKLRWYGDCYATGNDIRRWRHCNEQREKRGNFHLSLRKYLEGVVPQKPTSVPLWPKGADENMAAAGLAFGSFERCSEDCWDTILGGCLGGMES